MKPVIFGLLLIFILNSCRKEILIDLPDHESLLVVNCFFSPEDTFKVKVSASSWLYDGGNKEQDSALVLLFADDLIGDTLIYTEEGLYVAPYLPVTGTVYLLRVESSGFPVARAENIAPSPVPIHNSSFDRNGGYNEDGYSYAKAVFSFQDPPGIDNFYELIIRVLDESYNYLRPISSDTIIIREGDYDFYPGTALFTDHGIDGLLYTLEVYFTHYSDSDDIRYLMELRTISPEFYAYKKRLIRHTENQYSDIWDGMGNPLPMFSNIENGYGIFAGYSSSYDTLY